MDKDEYLALTVDLMQLLSSEKNCLDVKELKLLSEFVEAGEFGVALQTFVDVVVAKRHAISRASVARIETLAKRMKIESELPLAEMQRSVRL